MNLNQFLATIAAEIEEQLEQLLPEEKGTTANLYEAMRYSALAGGKRLRPALFCATLSDLGQDYRPYLPFAAALEMIHCYSLVHDDLPAMDNDTLRRGKPSCHVAFGEATAILAGDALLSLAASILTRPQAGVDAANQLQMAGIILEEAQLMVEGQAMEMAAYQPDLLLLLQIYAGKTAALFRAAVLGAAAIAGLGFQQQLALRNYADNLGVVFQIIDDILDESGNEEDLGKPPGSDCRNNKLTIARLIGIEEAQKLAVEAAGQAEAVLAHIGGGKVLPLFPQFLLKRDK